MEVLAEQLRVVTHQLNELNLRINQQQFVPFQVTRGGTEISSLTKSTHSQSHTQSPPQSAQSESPLRVSFSEDSKTHDGSLSSTINSQLFSLEPSIIETQSVADASTVTNANVTISTSATTVDDESVSFSNASTETASSQAQSAQL